MIRQWVTKSDDYYGGALTTGPACELIAIAKGRGYEAAVVPGNVGSRSLRMRMAP